jgi:P27 family predicted phage terminase small subunit
MPIVRRDRVDPKVRLMPRATAPASLRLISGRGNGTDSGGRKVAQVPAFKRLPPEAPDWLPDEAAAEWARIVPELSRLELLKPVDRASLTAYCLTWQRLVDAQKLVAENRILSVQPIRDDAGEVIDAVTIDGYGLLGKNSQGIVRAPWVAIAEAASKELRAWAGEFGFTPSAENKLSVREADDDEADPFS